jgi:DNA modification methylase
VHFRICRIRVDLMFADPPYNLTKSFNDRKFRKTSIDEYTEWLDSWLSQNRAATQANGLGLYLRRLAQFGCHSSRR